MGVHKYIDIATWLLLTTPHQLAQGHVNASDLQQKKLSQLSSEAEEVLHEQTTILGCQASAHTCYWGMGIMFRTIFLPLTLESPGCLSPLTVSPPRPTTSHGGL